MRYREKKEKVRFNPSGKVPASPKLPKLPREIKKEEKQAERERNLAAGLGPRGGKRYSRGGRGRGRGAGRGRPPKRARPRRESKVDFPEPKRARRRPPAPKKSGPVPPGPPPGKPPKRPSGKPRISKKK